MISVGAVIGGPECASYDKELRRFMTYCKNHSQPGNEEAEVNIVFHLPGSICKPKPAYVGPRLSKISTARRIAMVQVGIAEHIAAMRNGSEILESIFSSATAAIRLAHAEFSKRTIAYDLEKDLGFIDEWRASTSPIEA